MTDWPGGGGTNGVPHGNVATAAAGADVSAAVAQGRSRCSSGRDRVRYEPAASTAGVDHRKVVTGEDMAWHARHLQAHGSVDVRQGTVPGRMEARSEVPRRRRPDGDRGGRGVVMLQVLRRVVQLSSHPCVLLMHGRPTASMDEAATAAAARGHRAAYGGVVTHCNGRLK